MATIEELQEQVVSLEALVQQALERSMRHGAEHWIEGTDPTAIRWQVGEGAPSHEAEEGTPYWDSTNNVGYVNSDGGSTWEALAAGGGGGSAHNIISTTHSDAALDVPVTGDMLIRSGLSTWVPAQASAHGNHPTAASIADADKYEIYLSFGSEREVFSPA